MVATQAPTSSFESELFLSLSIPSNVGGVNCADAICAPSASAKAEAKVMCVLMFSFSPKSIEEVARGL
jgi:hypothetical protein